MLALNVDRAIKQKILVLILRRISDNTIPKAKMYCFLNVLLLLEFIENC